ncbi:MAG: hypothetical protein QG622_3616 [Actinomycetota bacterium]|nr:hypothetical protein [Actinomycetota bacterium]
MILLEGPQVAAEEQAGAPAPVVGSASWLWRPATPLPEPEVRGRPTDIFYTPHPDDETLSMGVLIAAATQRGDRVIVVGLSDGRTTGAMRSVDDRLARPGPWTTHVLTQDGIAAARVGELRRAVADLGVMPENVFLAHLDAPGTDGGSTVTVAEAQQVMRAFAERFPGATHLTMSFVAERQLDHLDSGVALKNLRDAGVVRSARWAVSRLWWTAASPAWSWVRPGTVALQRVRRALREYRVWNPELGEYAIGFTSVRSQFLAQAQDTRDRVHGAGSMEPTPVSPRHGLYP